MVLKLHRFFQTMTAVLHLQILFQPTENEILKEITMIHDIPMEVKLGYKNSQDLDGSWHQMAKAKIKKEFTCIKGKNILITLNTILLQCQF